MQLCDIYQNENSFLYVRQKYEKRFRIYANLRYLCLFVHSGVQHILTILITWWVSCCRHALLTFTDVCVHPGFLLRSVLYFFFLVCVVLSVFVLCFLYPMLQFSLDCPFFIASSVFSNVFLNHGFAVYLFSILFYFF